MRAFRTWKGAQDELDAMQKVSGASASVIVTRAVAVEYLETFYNKDTVAGIDYIPYALMHEIIDDAPMSYDDAVEEVWDAALSVEQNQNNVRKLLEDDAQGYAFTEVQYGDVDFDNVKRSGSRSKKNRRGDFASFVNQWELWQVWTR